MKSEYIIIWLIIFLSYITFGYVLFYSDQETWENLALFLGYSFWMIGLGLSLARVKITEKTERKE